MSDAAAYERLGHIVQERVRDLGLTDALVYAAGGPSRMTMKSIYAGEPKLRRPQMIMQLEDILGWEPGSYERVLAGGSAISWTEDRQREVIITQLAEIQRVLDALAKRFGL